MSKVIRVKEKEVVFKLYAPQAKKVSVAGSFNDWKTEKYSGKKDSKGNWGIKVDLKPGRYEYKFFVDGSWVIDPKCSNNAYNAFGSQNSVIEVK